MKYARPLSAVLLAVIPFAAACGGDDDSADSDDVVTEEVLGEDDASDGVIDGDDLEPMDGVPAECAEAYPMAVVPADPADLELPADWPAPPEGSVLCTTSSTLDGSMESAQYAVASPSEEILAHYEAALTGYEMQRTPGVSGDMLDGFNDTHGFQVQPGDGGFTLVVGTL